MRSRELSLPRRSVDLSAMKENGAVFRMRGAGEGLQLRRSQRCFRFSVHTLPRFPRQHELESRYQNNVESI